MFSCAFEEGFETIHFFGHRKLTHATCQQSDIPLFWLKRDEQKSSSSSLLFVKGDPYWSTWMWYANQPVKIRWWNLRSFGNLDVSELVEEE